MVWTTQKIVSDHRLQFASAFTRELARLLQYDITLSSAYHPQTDGEIECYNWELKTYLCIFCKGQPQKWLELLMAKFAHNAAIHSVTGKFLFSLIMGYEPQFYPPLRRTFLPALKQQLNQIEDAYKKAKATHILTQQQIKEWTFSYFKPWKVKDKVWLETRNLKLQVPSRKLSAKWTSSFEIMQVISSIAFWLKLSKQWKIHDAFHASLLLSYRKSQNMVPTSHSPHQNLLEWKRNMKLTKSSITEVLLWEGHIWFAGKAILMLSRLGSWSQTWAMLWQCSRNIKTIEYYDPPHDSLPSITSPHPLSYLPSPYPSLSPSPISRTWHSKTCCGTFLLLLHYLLPLLLQLLDSWWHSSLCSWTIYSYSPIIFYMPPSSKVSWPTRHSMPYSTSPLMPLSSSLQSFSGFTQPFTPFLPGRCL